MTCSQFQRRLSAYLDGESSRWSRWKVETHLRYCPDCAGTLREMAAIDSNILAATQAPPCSEYLTGAVMRRLPAMPPARHSRRGMMPWMAGLALAGMQATVLFGAYWWGFIHGSASNPGLMQNGMSASPAGAGTAPMGPAGGGGAFPFGRNLPERTIWTTPHPEFVPSGAHVMGGLSGAAAPPSARQVSAPLGRPRPAWNGAQ
jgi:hypothetical protein